jgi:hypothetical protein
VPETIDPPFPHAQAGAFLGLAAVGGLIVFSSEEAELKGISTLGFVLCAIGVLGISRLVQRHFLLIFNARFKRLADVSVTSIGLGVLLSLWFYWHDSASLGWLASAAWWVGIVATCASFGLAGIGFVGQLRVAMQRPRRR